MVNRLPILSKIDTGTQYNVVPLNIYQKPNPQPDIQPVNLKLSGYSNSEITVIGKSSLALENKNELLNVSFIVNTKSVRNLGLEACENVKPFLKLFLSL